MKCLIIAAGQGTRIRARGESKPLVPLLGTPLIEWVMRAALQGGVEGFVVVTGYNGPRLRAFLDGFACRAGTTVTHVINQEWERPNGVSVLKARDVLDEPFLLSMSDHLFDPAIVADLTARPPAAGETILAVDYDVTNPIIDLDDVTRVRVADGRIEQIGKGLPDYNAFDTGLFYATPALFDAIAESIAERDDYSLSGGMRVLAARGKARVFDIGGRFWLDVDEPEEADLAERLLHEDVVGKLRAAYS